MRKMNNKKLKLTAKEEEVMDLFWEHGPMFVRDMLEYYNNPKPHFNTVSTIVRGLEERGLVTHDAFGKSFRYKAAISKEEYSRQSINSLIGKYFNSSPFSMVSSLVKNEELSEKEIRELLKMVEQNKKK
jgi:predicted transcriptional regulator